VILHRIVLCRLALLSWHGNQRKGQEGREEGWMVLESQRRYQLQLPRVSRSSGDLHS
jgi:hypothetical protein